MLKLASAQQLAAVIAATTLWPRRRGHRQAEKNAKELLASYNQIEAFILKMEDHKGMFGKKTERGASSIDNSRQSIERLKDEIAQLDTAALAGEDGDALFAPEERDMVARVIRLSGRTARFIMIPRQRVNWLGISLPPRSTSATLAGLILERLGAYPGCGRPPAPSGLGVGNHSHGPPAH